jgi:hypothetical protein
MKSGRSAIPVQTKSWTLVYQGSRDGFAAPTVHGKYNGQSNAAAVKEMTVAAEMRGYNLFLWGRGADIRKWIRHW